MPFLEVSHPRSKGKKTRPVNLFYELYGSGDTKCLLIMGLAGTHSAWAYQLKELAGTDIPNSPNMHTPSGNDIAVSATAQLEAEEKAKAEMHRDSNACVTKEEEAVLEELEGLEVEDDDGSSSEGLSRSTTRSSLELNDVGKDSDDMSKDSDDMAKSNGATGKSSTDVSENNTSAGRNHDDVSKSSVALEDRETGGMKNAGVVVRPPSTGRLCCAYDNRGVGRSTIPKKKSDYNTTIMAEDALALLDHLGWEKAHIFGHSMGGMIACKLAAIAPQRVASLALISVTGGGFECIPAMNKNMINISYRFLRAKDPVSRADVDLDCHFSPEYLEENIEGGRRRDVLYKEYVQAISAAGLQPKHGLKGHENACWTHRVDDDEIETIRKGGFLISVIHGRADIVASIHHANKLTKRLAPVARLVAMLGGHLVLRESAEQVNKALTTLIVATQMGIPGEQWGSVLNSQGSLTSQSSLASQSSLTSQSSDNIATLATIPVSADEKLLPGKGMRLRNYLNTFQDVATRKLLSIQRTSSGDVLKNLKKENLELRRTSSGDHVKLVLQT